MKLKIKKKKGTNKSLPIINAYFGGITEILISSFCFSSPSNWNLIETGKDFLLKNPDKVPYLLNHSRNESYPEKYFWNIFNKENIGIVKSYRIGLYELDFSIPNKKIDIEIDGNQHYYDDKIVESDIRRSKYLEELGWDIIRIRWSDYQKMDNKSKEKYIVEIFSYINRLILKKPTIEIIYKIKNKCKCGKEINKRSLKCKKCYQLSQRKVERPSLEILLKEIEELGYVGTSKKYGVSDNSIRKWIKTYTKI